MLNTILLAVMITWSSFSTEIEPKNYQIDSQNWNSTLLTETCVKELKEAAELAIESLGEGNWIAILPKKIGYQYFKVEFRKLDGVLAADQGKVLYEFRYWTKDDQHMACNRVEPEGVDE